MRFSLNFKENFKGNSVIFSPAHEAGKAKLEVAYDGIVMSKAVIFEYKLQETTCNQKDTTLFMGDELIETGSVKNNSVDNSDTLSLFSQATNCGERDSLFEERVWKYTLLQKIDVLKDGMERKMEDISIKDKVIRSLGHILMKCS